MKALHIALTTGQSPRQTAVLAGLRAKGVDVAETYNRGEIKSKSPDFAVCSGLNRLTHDCREECVRLGIPILIVELGYMKRAHSNADVDGYYQLGWNKLGWVPESAPPDRFEALDLEVKETRADGSVILVASQVGLDAQHQMRSQDLNQWLLTRSEAVSKSLGLPRLWRPHPRQTDQIPGGWAQHRVQWPAQVPLERALEKVAHVVTYNSTFGVDAMIQGVPVTCCPRAHYASAASANKEGRLAYLRRLAYAQWTLDEMRSGHALEYVLTQIPK